MYESRSRARAARSLGNSVDQGRGVVLLLCPEVAAYVTGRRSFGEDILFIKL